MAATSIRGDDRGAPVAVRDLADQDLAGQDTFEAVWRLWFAGRGIV